MDDAFDVFYRATCRRLIRFAYGLTGDPVEAQDLVQEAYVRAWQRWRRLRGYDDAEAWLRLVVTRLVTDRWRWLGVRRAASASEPPPLPVEPPSEDTVLVVGALRSLPMAQRRALVLHYLLDRPVADIAIETGASIGTVKSWLSRGRANMLAALRMTTPEADRESAQAERVAGGHDA
jgi:RNA polymerase sigma-70 factor (sigma-E family)